jgi:hypothetical protein
MTFQYRVMRHRNKFSPEFVANMRKTYPDYKDYAEYLDIREVYYKDDAPKGEALGPEWVTMYTETSHDISGETLTELADDIKYFALAMSLPILNEWELPGYEEKDVR